MKREASSAGPWKRFRSTRNHSVEGLKRHAIIPLERAYVPKRVKVAEALEVKFVSDPRWLRPVRLLVKEYAEQAGFSPETQQEVELAVGEALTNVMRHSYGGDTTRPIDLRCALRDGAFEIEVRDHGEPFDVADLPPPPDELRAGGRGVYLIRTIMDSVEYLREDNRNLLRMTKRPASS